MFAGFRRMANRRVRRDRLFATERMLRLRDEPEQLWRGLCYDWWWGVGHSIRRGWYFVRLIGSLRHLLE